MKTILIHHRKTMIKCKFDILCRSAFIKNLRTKIFSKCRTYCVVKQPTLPHNHTYEVIVSKSNNIFANLSLEEWLYENWDLSKKSVLLMWKNKPCVVIGRHQNPWLECNVSKALTMSVDIVRRASGGGTVYHDEGNLNCSFITDKCRYNRCRNLQFVIDAIKSRWDLDLEVNTRDDIILDQLYKVSGTASRLTRTKTYHHFTLLYRTDTDNLHKLLTSPFGTGVNSKATRSVSAQVKNMSDFAPDMDFSSLVQVIGQHFHHGGLDQEFDQQRFGEIQFVDPRDDEMFPELHKLQSDLENWDWIYGKTPKFWLKKNYCTVLGGKEFTVSIATEINKGKITQIDFSYLDTNHNDQMVNILKNVRDIFIGQRFWIDELEVLILKLKNDKTVGNYGDTDLFNWILCCLKDTLYI